MKTKEVFLILDDINQNKTLKYTVATGLMILAIVLVGTGAPVYCGVLLAITQGLWNNRDTIAKFTNETISWMKGNKPDEYGIEKQTSKSKDIKIESDKNIDTKPAIDLAQTDIEHEEHIKNGVNLAFSAANIALSAGDPYYISPVINVAKYAFDNKNFINEHANYFTNLVGGDNSNENAKAIESTKNNDNKKEVSESKVNLESSLPTNPDEKKHFWTTKIIETKKEPIQH
jgi:hypothetical protein